MDHERAEHLRKTVTGACMIAAPILFIVADSLWPVEHTEGPKMVADAAGNTDQAYAATLVGLVAMVLIAGAVIGLAHMLHERRPGLAFVAGAFGLTGVVINAAGFGMLGFFLAEAPDSSSNAVMGRLLDDMTSRAAPLMVFGVTLMIGTILFGIGLARAHIIPTWAAVCMALGGIGITVGNSVAAKNLIISSEVLLLVGLGSIGLQVLTETDEEWEHTPDFHGYRARAVTA